MPITRRDAITLSLAALVAPSVSAQGRRFAAAAAYSAQHRGQSLLVMERGRIVFEDYPNGGAADMAHELASGTKSFSGLIVAALVQDRLLSLDEPCARTLSEWRGDARRAITIRHLLSLTSGLQPAPVGRAPAYEYAIQAQAIVEPGARFAYGPGPFQVFGEIVKRKLAAAGRNPDPLVYLRARLLDPLSISIGNWRRGSDGNPLLPQGASFTAREWAKFGHFVVRGGDGRVDGAALAANFAPSSANPGYGLTWWLLRPGIIGPTPAMPIDAPDAAASLDIRMAAGAGDQRLYLIPQRDMVVVRQAPLNLRALMRREGVGEARFSDRAFLTALLGPL